MKHIIITLLFLVLKFSIYAEVNHYHTEKTRIVNIVHAQDRFLSKTQLVYICSGPYAYAYHSKSDCPGLNNCKWQINYTDEYTAVHSFNRTPCCRCWSNVYGNCKDDNPSPSVGSSSGSSGGVGLGVLVIAVTAASLFVLSNDMYLYPAISFCNLTKNYNQFEPKKSYGIGKGWLFGFRKTFKYSALEYGLSYFKYAPKYTIDNSYTNLLTKSRFGGHFNYVHQIFYNLTPEWLKV